MTQLRQAVVTLELHKCQFGSKGIEHLGHILIRGRVVAASQDVNRIKTAGFPTDSTGIRFFSGVAICTEDSSKIL